MRLVMSWVWHDRRTHRSTDMIIQFVPKYYLSLSLNNPVSQCSQVDEILPTDEERNCAKRPTIVATTDKNTTKAPIFLYAPSNQISKLLPVPHHFLDGCGTGSFGHFLSASGISSLLPTTWFTRGPSSRLLSNITYLLLFCDPFACI